MHHRGGRDDLERHGRTGRLPEREHRSVADHERPAARFLDTAGAKRIAIVQSNYVPWKGYFDMIGRVDEFVLFDDVQFTRRDWRNRNTIKTKDGLRWLTIPVAVKGKYYQKINETEISETSWREAHLAAIRHSYARAPHFRDVFPWLERLFARLTATRLSDVNRTALEALCERLEIATPITSSSDYELVEGKNERLIELCAQAGATRYLSGPAARGYVDEGAFRARGIEVEWMDYSGYPEYPQLFPPFEHNVSVLDVLFNTGPDAASYVRRR